MSTSSTNEGDKTLLALAASFRGHRERQIGEHAGGEQASRAETAASSFVAEDGHRPSAISPMSSFPEDNIFHSAVVETAEEEHDDEEPAYPEAAPEELLPPPDFEAFFTLIEDTDTGEHHHPSVHYVFSDDDPEMLTAAALAAIQQQTVGSQHEEVEERIVLLDMSADGKTVTTAASLSPRWQALKVNVGQAPSWGGASQGGDCGLMLKVSGEEVAEKSRRQRKAASANIDDLMGDFHQRLDGLDEIIGKIDATTMSDESTIDKTNV